MYMEKLVKEVELIKIYLAVGMCIFGCVLLIMGFIVDPLGVISQSVLIAFGEVITFASALIGINYLYSAKHKELENRLLSKINNGIRDNVEVEEEKEKNG